MVPIVTRHFIVLVSMFICNICMAKFIPEEFAHLYSPQKLTMTFFLPNNVKGVVAIVGNYEEAINVSKNDKSNLYNLMLKSGIKKERINDIIGVVFKDKSCKTFCSDTVVKYDYDAEEVSIFVPASYLDGKYIEHKYVDQDTDTQGIIINNKIYFTAYDSNIDSTYSVQGLMGLGKGFFRTDLDISSSNSNDSYISINEMSYDLSMRGHQLYFGYNKYGHNIENITSTLDNTTPNSQFYAAIESSNNLLSRGPDSSNKIYFDMKNKGMVSIVRDGKIIKNSYFTSGQHYINYSSLPRGNYEVKIILKPDGMKEEIMYKTINNSASDRSVNGYDYHVSFNNIESEEGNLSYLQGLYSVPIYDKVDLGLGIKTNLTNNFLSLQTGITLNDLYASGYIDKVIGSKTSYKNLQANYENFQINYSNYNKDESEGGDFSDAIYNDSSYTQYSIGANFKVFDGRLSLFKNFSSREQDFGIVDNSSLSLSYSTTIFNDWFLQLGYTKNTNDSNTYYYQDGGNSKFDDNNISINLNIPLSNDVIATSTTDISDDQNIRFINSIEYSNVIDNKDLNVGGSLTSTISDMDPSMGASVNFRNKSDLLSISGYGYVDSQGSNNVNGTIESSILIPETYNEIYFTKEQSDSYLIVNSNRDEMQNGIAYIERNQANNTSVMLNGSDSVIPVSSYDFYEYELDYESSGFQSNSQTKKTAFTYPGTISVINSNIKKVVSFMTYFEDFNKESLNNIRCVGDGCVDVTRVGDGIYSISVYDNYNYKIVSNNEYCLVDNIELEQGAKKSICFPNIKEDKDSGLQIVNHGLGHGDETFIYLGYMKSIPNDIYQNLVENGISPQGFKFGDEQYYWFAKLTNTNKRDLIKLAKLEVMDKVEQLANKSYDLYKYSRVN